MDFDKKRQRHLAKSRRLLESALDPGGHPEDITNCRRQLELAGEEDDSALEDLLLDRTLDEVEQGLCLEDARMLLLGALEPGGPRSYVAKCRRQLIRAKASEEDLADLLHGLTLDEVEADIRRRDRPRR